MVKISESAIKTVNYNKRKWLLRLTKTVTGVGRTTSSCGLVTHTPPGREQAPNPANFSRRNVETSYRSPRGQQAVKSAYGDASLGCRKKRRLGCNGPDTGLNVTRHESEPTSDWSYLARECAESL
jgi:hypothetical protein